MVEPPILEVTHLTTKFQLENGMFSAVDDISFSVNKGETVCIVGESGCGKSITALSIMGLVPSPPGVPSTGVIKLEGENLLDYTQKEMLKVRGKDISMIFQEPMTSLNPVFQIGPQVAEVLLNHKKIKKSEALKLAVEMLRKVGISQPEIRAKAYPHQLSGGMRQRVMIAMALACNPKLLIADEPTTALDVTIQAQILELMKALKSSFGTAIVLITHDLGVVADMADRVVVMYAGSIVEVTDVFSLFKNPSHPYTEGLLQSIPRMEKKVKHLNVTDGSIPMLNEMPQGCKFHPRCPYATEKCRNERPALKEIAAGHQVACWYAEVLTLEGVKVV
ncbi:ABC transporter ATP-binding protein [Bacillus sp. MRMR6]|uniref:ABC transporter ATP-binding protein n=1 Tax=Bacillus sp. MRMR6 TaxID=1928617 RepID=UPI0009535F67|nr:ABC transporter ATP-binding protein [Bacillus sp. MRMR6]OLS34716.1 peptide ABC transporter ATP-binding protein [Bacillus sp. MRMR6]